MRISQIQEWVLNDKIRLAVATGNRGKLKEIEELLAGLGVEIFSTVDSPDFPEVEEDGTTFGENALKKAREFHRHTGLPCIADDSGLAVDALGGRPGIYSARYAGEGADDRKNNQKLLREMLEVPDAKRGCAFICYLAFVDGDDELLFTGELRGEVLRNPAGEGGFGYDPLFYLPDFRASVAEISPGAKNRISHRGQALRKFAAYFKNRFFKENK